MAAGLLCAGSALADTTVTFADLELDANPTEFTAGTDFKFVADQNGGTTKPAYNANNKDLRLYAKNTLTVTSGADITSMVFNISKQGKKRLTDGSRFRFFRMLPARRAPRECRQTRALQTPGRSGYSSGKRSHLR